MGLIRVELMTPSLSEKCSNRLSYRPKIKREEGRDKAARTGPTASSAMAQNPDRRSLRVTRLLFDSLTLPAKTGGFDVHYAQQITLSL